LTQQPPNSIPRLILVDGFAGSGKSTTAQRLWLHFIQHGCDASWFHEHQLDHPIFYYDEVDELLRLEVRTFEEQIMANWESFANDAEAQPTRILEGSFFQITTGVLLAMNTTARKIEQMLLRIAATVKKLNPALIYLFHEDTREGLLRIRDHRGMYWLNGMTQLLGQSPYGRQNGVRDFEGLAEFYRRQRLIIESVFSRLEFKKMAVDISGRRWDSYDRRMAAFLKIGELMPLDLPVKQLLKYAGRYKGKTTGNECVVTTDAKSLYLHYVDSHAGKLLPVDHGHFVLRSLPIDIRFDFDRTGLARRITINSRIADRRTTDRTWTRS
jgi:hypothetical protein